MTYATVRGTKWRLPNDSYRYDWRGPMADCPIYRLGVCETIFFFWELPVHDLMQEGEDPRDAFKVEYLPPLNDCQPGWELTACEWIVPGVFTW